MKERKGKKQEWEVMRKDYRTYHFTAKETGKYLLEGTAVCAAADYLFYQNILALLFMIPVPENAKEKMYCQAEAGVKLPVPGCTDIHECSSSGRVFCGKCSAGSCKGSGKTLRKQE